MTASFSHKRHLDIFGLLSASVLLMLLTTEAVTAGNFARHQGYVSAHHAQGNRRVAYLSPDGKYAARVSYEDDEVKDGVVLITIHRKGLQGSGLASFSGVEGFGWVPNRQHTFVVSTDGGHNGTGILAVWTAKKGKTVLLHGKELEDDNFDIKKISNDGNKVIYEHFGYGVSERHPEHGRGQQQLSLPSS